MALTAVASLATAWWLRLDAAYALTGGPPTNVGALTALAATSNLSNRWVRGEGPLEVGEAIRYRRPLESDIYQMAQVTGNPRLWVQIRIPASVDASHFVPPASFVGRLVPVTSAGLRFQALDEAVAAAGARPMPDNAWLLLDGETPGSTGWAVALVAMLLLFGGFNVWGLIRLTRPLPAD